MLKRLRWQSRVDLFRVREVADALLRRLFRWWWWWRVGRLGGRIKNYSTLLAARPALDDDAAAVGVDDLDGLLLGRARRLRDALVPDAEPALI